MQGGPKIIDLEVGHLVENLFCIQAGSEEVKNIDDANPHTANAGSAYQSRDTEVQIELFPMQSGPQRHNFHGRYISCARTLKTLQQMDWDHENGPVGQLYDKPFGLSIVAGGPRPRFTPFGFLTSSHGLLVLPVQLRIGVFPLSPPVRPLLAPLKTARAGTSGGPRTAAPYSS